jgi:8-amino-7-oxononanoate synthase
MAEQVGVALRLAQGMDAERAVLRQNAERLCAALRAQELDTAGSETQIIPVILGENEEALSAAKFLQQRGFAVRAIRPPTVAPGTARLRLSLTTAIAESELTHLAESLQDWRTSQRHGATVGAAAGNS